MLLSTHYRMTRPAACLLAIGALVGGYACAPAVEPPAPAAAPEPDPIERGEYLVTVMDCNGCHTPFVEGEPDLSRMLMGHPEDIEITEGPARPEGWGITVSETNTAWSGPWGVSFTTNLTPDPETGIGNWTEDRFVNAIRNGRHLGVGRPILPPMPWPMYAQLTDFDIRAMFAYLQSIPAIVNQVPDPIEP